MSAPTLSRESNMPPPLTPPALLLLLLAAPVALAQTTLGELLDGGAARVSGEAFKRDVVQQVLIGTTPTGGRSKSCT